MAIPVQQKKPKNGEGLRNYHYRGEADVEISILSNSPYYFLHSVFIVKEGEGEGFRLVIIHNNRVLTDQRYETLRGARISFAKSYGDKAWVEDIQAQWTHFYPPDAKWLEAKLKVTVRKTK